ncbi:MAG TPA: PadR family transcriptional regulator, partial [Gammaproteobacteria bacterium]
MDVKDLCLGALTYGDATGYDLKKFFESTFSHCFLAGYGSIYPALAELTEEQLVVARTVPG